MEQAELKVLRGSIVIANQDRKYKNKENVITVKTGDKFIVGYDGLLHSLDKNIALTIEDELEVEGYSATGLAKYLVAWLDAQLDLSENLRRTMLGLNDFVDVIENALTIVGMQREEIESE